MNIYFTLSLLITFAIAVAYLNHRFIKMQPTIAIMFGSLLVSLILLSAEHFGFTIIEHHIASTIKQLRFHDLLINGMLSFLLFAGGLTIDMGDLRNQKWEVGILAAIGTIISAFLVAFTMFFLLPLFGLHLPFIYCMLFGALISPTDPIAVLAMCKEVKAPKNLETIIAGESLFNDGVGIVIFLTTLHIALGGHANTPYEVIELFGQQAVGGIAYGALLGAFGAWLMKPVDDHRLEILITIFITTGGYVLAQLINISGPLAMVVAGIVIGNYARHHALSPSAKEHLDVFWELVDELLNALLFILIGFELLIIPFTIDSLWAALLAIPTVLFIRMLIVSGPMVCFKTKKQYPKHTVSILIWGGLRGGLAVALALALPPSPYRNLILIMTYAVVVFSILIQGTSIKPLVTRSKKTQLTGK